MNVEIRTVLWLGGLFCLILAFSLIVSNHYDSNCNLDENVIDQITTRRGGYLPLLFIIFSFFFLWFKNGLTPKGTRWFEGKDIPWMIGVLCFYFFLYDFLTTRETCREQSFLDKMRKVPPRSLVAIGISMGLLSYASLNAVQELTKL